MLRNSTSTFARCRVSVPVSTSSGESSTPNRRSAEATPRCSMFCTLVSCLIDRQSVVSGTRVSVRVDIGGRRIPNTKQDTHTTYSKYRNNDYRIPLHQKF